ncbi:methyl-accepting chemotaxis protein [Desulfocurvus sp. DL9XJH121]
MHFKSIQLKIILLTGACLLVTVGALTGYSLMSSYKTQAYVTQRVNDLLEDGARKNLMNLAQAQAAKVQSALQVTIDTARTMAAVFEVLRVRMRELSAEQGFPNPVRGIMDDILPNVLKRNPSFLGTYSAWEPDALDGEDGEYRGKDGYDATGRFIPYWNKDEQGTMARQPLVDYESSEANPNGVIKGAWYLESRATGREVAVSPLPYIIQGKQDWLATLNAPIKDNGKYLGLAGSDLRLGFIQDLAKEVSSNLYEGKGEVLILSYAGRIVAHSGDDKAVGQPLGKLYKSAQSIIEYIHDAKPFVDIGPNSGLMRAFAPIAIGDTGKPWCVLIRISPEVVLAEARALEETLVGKARSGVMIQAAVGGGVLVAALGVLWLFSVSLVRPIRKAALFSEQVAQGDFTQELDIDQKDEIGVLAGSLRTMVDNLKTMIAQAEEKSREAAEEAEIARKATQEADEARREAGEATRKGMLSAAEKLEAVVLNVTSASEELSSQIDQSTQGANQQREHAGETASAMEEMNATVLEVARNASEAAENADQAMDHAREGALVVRQVVEAINSVQQQAEALKANMNELGKQSQDIGQIIDVISDIADQTNLLALNAAIEAARAGDAGRGFAVVADEVRKLAEKTMSATNEVSKAILAIQSGAQSSIQGVENATQAVDQATSLANQSGKVLEQIVSVVEQSADQVRSIATASEEQSAASEEINSSVTMINEISEITASTMRESLEAVKGLAEQASDLNALINELKSE